MPPWRGLSARVTPTWGQEVGATGCVVLSLPWKLGILGPQVAPVSGQTQCTVWAPSSGLAGVGCQVLRFPSVKWELVGPTR